MSITKLQKGQETLHPMPVPLEVWIQIGIDLLDSLKEIDGCKYIITALDYASKFAEAEPFKEKLGC